MSLIPRRVTGQGRTIVTCTNHLYHSNHKYTMAKGPALGTIEILHTFGWRELTSFFKLEVRFCNLNNPCPLNKACTNSMYEKLQPEIVYHEMQALFAWKLFQNVKTNMWAANHFISYGLLISCLHHDCWKKSTSPKQRWWNRVVRIAKARILSYTYLSTKRLHSITNKFPAGWAKELQIGVSISCLSTLVSEYWT